MTESTDPVTRTIVEKLYGDEPDWQQKLGLTDDDILERARQIEERRRDAVQCTAVSRGDEPTRCELPPGHDPYIRGSYLDARVNRAIHDYKPWDHAAPSCGVYWMER